LFFQAQAQPVVTLAYRIPKFDFHRSAAITPSELGSAFRRGLGGIIFGSAAMSLTCCFALATISRSDLYFKRHDGHAVTTGDFVQSLQDARATAETPVSLNRHSNCVPERGGVANRFDLEKAQQAH
jgi:hypothetical protein